ncbi:hypothetical protein BDV96DRAFT_605236 [Lophiotrema nucula]|uniref:F-box domain-containing protein n=1 Tax=Lophiotrema nucula TaxID=690887 RepID=A0A6A5YRK9_9PLEO|nr:hypothetical protein BDV96DRAFT_605236 [Lophiotrema nucula]
MSMLKLSSELDGRILSFLEGDRSALNSLSRVSKYYRGLAIPYLYKNLHFDTAQEDRIHYLLFTLLENPELALHVKTFALNTAPTLPPDKKNTAYYAELWDSVNCIRHTINDLGRHYLPIQVLLQWNSSVFAQYPSFDGQIAIVLCMATNLEELTMAYDLPISSWLLGTKWMPKEGETVYPFHKLKMLNCHTRLQPSCLPSLQTLKMRNCGGKLPCLPYKFPSGVKVQAMLQTLEITHVYFDLVKFESLLACQELRNLKTLKVCGVGNEIGDWNVENALQDLNQYDYTRMSAAISRYLPELEILHWKEVRYDREWGAIYPFGSLNKLTKLRDLEIMKHLLRNREQEDPLQRSPHLSDPVGHLPLSLQHILIDDVSDFELGELLKNYARTAEDREDTIQYLTQLISPFQDLKVVELGLDLTTDCGFDRTSVWEPKQTLKAFLRQLADELDKVGVVFEAFRMPHGFSEQKRVIVRAGYTRPWPVWDDVDSEEWSWKDKRRLEKGIPPEATTPERW